MVSQTGESVGDIIARNFVESVTSAKPITVEGVTFRCWHTGILRYEWRSDDGLIIVARNYRRSTWNAVVNGVEIGRRFLGLQSAILAAIKASK